ncbi:DUF4422 domain-containing protein [Clostridium sp. VAP51]|uniref:DUF4422 domain-containing protein n=1 Tax=Clostridium sp. VAP51 TaxID=2949978 RepID=UPI00207A73E0|nr:DUF4422 domain-containing protein [Clostridium sp. VAP51]
MQKDLIIYMATHNQKCSHIDDYIIPIQVGKDLNNKKIEEITDNTGDNISFKNNNFCELTALYWIWKNTNSKYVGLCHYRRRFKVIKKEILLCLKKEQVIVPIPKYFRMSVKEQYVKEHDKNEWNIMLEVLKEKVPEYYSSSKIIFKNNKLYSYNMFIGSRKFMNEYCEWLFQILFEVEKRVEKVVKNNYQIRYIGFLAERLFTLYIFHNKLIVNEKKVLFNNKIIWTESPKRILNNRIFRIKHKIEGEVYE